MNMPRPAQRPSGGKLSFAQRMDAHAERTGRRNAASTSRRAVSMVEGGDDLAENDAASVGSHLSHAPSLHPSVCSAMSEACSRVTIGAGDSTRYWDYQHRVVERGDLGHKCRECKMPFTTLGDPLTERRGARVSMRYHAECFSGYADPRSQASSSHHTGKLAGSQFEAAPQSKAGSKMRTSEHFTGGGATRTSDTNPGGGGGGGKQGHGLGMGSMGFGARSSRDAPPVERPPAGPGELSEAMLAAHNVENK